ncbi:P-type conjugative transfer protein TrbG [Nostoc sp. 3335mG]|nr:P-type conjugative transfer protein TrbG [Nostoc sp. 3335mG]
MNHILLAASALIAVPAFAQTSPPQTPPMTAANPTPPAPPAPVAAPSPPVAKQPAPRHRKPSPAELRVRTANAKATREPATPAFVNAVQVYPYGEGVLYRLFAAPERVSDIALQPGEAIVSVAAGDTARWTVGDTTSGAGESKRVHILVKPFAAGLSTNLVITTDRRAYHLQLDSTPATAMAALSWTYPQDEMIAIRRQQASEEAARPVASGLAVERLDFGYVVTGDKPAWRPLRAFDDGRQTFVEFPATVGVGEAPPLFVIGDRGDAQLVNYRMIGRFYVIDRLFDAAELRLGGKKQVVVRISRAETGRNRRWRVS